jgi:uncharacterized protein
MIQPAPVIVERDVPTRMRDGTVLRSDVYRPATGGPHPVLLGRTTYGKATWGTWIEPQRTAADGWVVVINDMRGQFASEGELDPFVPDVDDSHDLIEWLAVQPWSDGKVGMFGSSACGFVQLQAAAGRPPHLVSIAPFQTWNSFGRGCAYDPGGAFSLYTQEWALLVTTIDPARQIGGRREDFLERYQAIAQARWEVGRWHAHRPYRELPPLPRDVAPFFYRWLEHPDADGWWADRSVRHRWDRVDLPGFHLAGWFDRFCRSTVENYVAMQREGGAFQKLIVGPWPHGVPVVTASGDRFFGPRAWVDSRAEVVRWHERWLKDVPNGIDEEPPVRLYIFGEEAWRDADAWPLPGTRFTPFHLHSAGSANTRRGDGVLDPTAPGDQPHDTYVYDPEDPTPSVPGATYRPVGTVDQGPIEDRRDVLCFTTPPLERDLDVIGPVIARLWAATTAPDTDWMVKLVDVHPDGYVFRLCEGMIRARYRESQAQARLLEPDRIYEYEIDLGPVGVRFLAGHRIRVEIASASFAQFDPNMNTGHVFGEDVRGVPAIQRIFHDAEHPSHVVLPIVGD